MFGIVLGFNYGQLDLPITHRLALPFMVPMICATIMLYEHLAQWKLIRFAMFATSTLWLGVVAIPIATRHAYSRDYMPAHGIAWARTFASEVAPEKTLFIGDLPVIFILEGRPAISTARANREREIVRMVLEGEGGPKRKVFLFQRRTKERESGGVIPADIYAPAPAFRWKIRERRILSDVAFVEMWELVSIDESVDPDVLP